jgi:hypothetical protein
MATVELHILLIYELDGSSDGHYQQVCPRCRRALFGLAQGRLWADSRNTELTRTTDEHAAP